MCEYIYKCYRVNRLREVLSYNLNDETFKINVLVYIEEEVNSYLGDDLYLKSPIKLLTQLILRRAKKEHYISYMKIIRLNKLLT
ncbi:hypothetical protein ACUW6T_002186 [Staphylococcus hominis]